MFREGQRRKKYFATTVVRDVEAPQAIVNDCNFEETRVRKYFETRTQKNHYKKIIRNEFEYIIERLSAFSIFIN